jgi:hypothetical protein
MPLIAFLLCHPLLGQSGAKIAPEHPANPIYEAVRGTGLEAEGALAKLGEPLLRRGMSSEEQREILLKLVGSSKALDDFLEASVTAPFKSKLHDWRGTTGTIRGFDIYFAVHAKLDEISSDDIDGQAKKSGNTDAGGMHFEGRSLEVDELKKLGITQERQSDRFGRIECSLLDKVEAKLTNRSLATRSETSLLVATKTIDDQSASDALRNVWRSAERRAGKLSYGPWQPYAGVIAYTKASRLDFSPDTLFVEIHGAFAEPKAWFNGRGILTSKISLVAKDKIPALRREIAKRREKSAAP